MVLNVLTSVYSNDNFFLAALNFYLFIAASVGSYLYVGVCVIFMPCASPLFLFHSLTFIPFIPDTEIRSRWQPSAQPLPSRATTHTVAVCRHTEGWATAVEECGHRHTKLLLLSMLIPMQTSPLTMLRSCCFSSSRLQGQDILSRALGDENLKGRIHAGRILVL